MGRTPPEPKHIRDQLRKEVGYKCPICGSIFLFSHHFDPPWKMRHHYDPNGMIALCAECHNHADQGKYTKDQLRMLETELNPSLAKAGWQRNEIIFLAGGFYINPRVFLRLNGRDIIWYNRDQDGNFLLNLDIRDENGRSIILMRDNDLVKFGQVDEIFDVAIPPHGQSLSLRSPKQGIAFSIQFRNCDKEELKELGGKMDMRLDEKPGPRGPVGPYASVSPEQLGRMLAGSRSTFERDTILALHAANTSLLQMPTRWETLTSLIRSWPVTVCTVTLRMERPFREDIRSEAENICGWRAGHTLSFGGDVVWNLECQAPRSETVERKARQENSKVRHGGS